MKRTGGRGGERRVGNHSTLNPSSREGGGESLRQLLRKVSESLKAVVGKSASQSCPGNLDGGRKVAG